MSIATEITRLNNAKAAIKSSIEAKGVTVPQDAKIDSYSVYIEQIPQGGGEYEPICFTSLEDGNTFQLNKEISISVDGKQTWQTLAANTNSPVINTGEKIYFKATDNAFPFAGTTSDYYEFTTSKTCNVSGHPYSLYAKGSFYFFANLFNSTKIVDASSLTLDADIVSNGCYDSMFEGCTSLTTAPELPATTLANSCYNAMFRDCTNLVTAPELPATTLADYCYQNMFTNCSSLVTAPELPATTLTTWCYYYMFYNCSSLKYVKCLATDISATNCTRSWLLYVASTGTFVKAAEMEDWLVGDDGLPSGWTVVNDNA